MTEEKECDEEEEVCLINFYFSFISYLECEVVTWREGKTVSSSLIALVDV